MSFRYVPELIRPSAQFQIAEGWLEISVNAFFVLYSRPESLNPTVHAGALIIRIGFWGFLIIMKI